MRHGDFDECLGGIGPAFVIDAQAPAADQPAQGSLDDPSFGKHLEALRLGAALDDLQAPSAEGRDERRQFLAGIGAVGPDHREPREQRLQPPQDEDRAVAILDGGGMNDDGEDQAEGIDDDVPLAALDLFPGVEAAGPPFSASFTLWLSLMAAMGLASLPSFSRTARSNVS